MLSNRSCLWNLVIALVESQNGRNKKTKQVKFFLIVSEGKESFFFERVGLLCFLVTSILRFAFFALLPTIGNETL